MLIEKVYVLVPMLIEEVYVVMSVLIEDVYGLFLLPRLVWYLLVGGLLNVV
jgi:hypothetical protein